MLPQTGNREANLHGGRVRSRLTLPRLGAGLGNAKLVIPRRDARKTELAAGAGPDRERRSTGALQFDGRARNRSAGGIFDGSGDNGRQEDEGNQKPQRNGSDHGGWGFVSRNHREA